MGEVYKARQRRTGRVVALKTVPPAGDPQGPGHLQRLERLRAEADEVSRLQHPHLVALYETGEQDGRPYFTMEWVEGRAWPSGWPGRRCPSGRRRGGRNSSPRPSTTPTSAAWSTVT